MSYLKDREIWLSKVPTGNPPAGFFWKFIQNGKVVVRDSNGNNQMMIATNGNQAITGSLIVTGGITGTISSASYVQYSNVANKPTLVSGSSQVTFLGLSSIPSGIVSGSSQVAQFGYATTGSNGFNGSQSITGSLTVTGQVIAQTLNVQQVTSSVVFSSGSNVFGNNTGNTHRFTGSLGVTGSLTVAGALNGTSAAFSDTITSTKTSEVVFTNTSGGTNRVYTLLSNTSGYLLTGIEGSTAGSLVTNSTAYAGVICTNSTSDLVLGTNFTRRLLIDKSTGAATFSSTVTATGGYFYGQTVNSFVRLDNSIGSQIGYLNYADITFDSDGHRFYTGTGTSGSRTQKFFIASSGAATFSSSVTAAGLIINNNGEALRAYGVSPNVSFYNSANTVRGGYVNHDGSNMNIVANVGGISLTGAATFNSEGITINRSSGNPYVIFQSNGSDLGSIYGNTGGGIRLRNASSDVLTIASTGAATFSSSVTANGVMSLGNDGTFGSTYKTLGLTGNTTGSHRIFAGTADDMYFAAATGRGFEFRVNGGNVGNLNITSAGNVGINSPSPNSKLEVIDGTGSVFRAINSGTNIMEIGNYKPTGSGGSGYQQLDIVSSTITFGTGTAGTGSSTERMRITSGGYTKVSNLGAYYAVGANFHELRNTIGDNEIVNFSHTAASPYGISLYYTAASPNNSSNWFLYCSDSTFQRMSIRSNGGIYNYQANDVNLSDERTKKDIEPLESYWDKFKAIEIVKFKYKDQTHDDFNIGVIAQQVEAVAPEFVDIDGWETKPELDEEGNEIVSTEEPLKSIYTADLHHATIKVLQEAMSKIEEQQILIESLKSRIEILEQ